ncbi:cytochrome c oxidase assembly protein [Methylobacterium sp. C25]|uniref:cytochrome c oxidase assembly protein n=1 Tax=Methylobacterium sp. C25 TaxID=2721622 RepID=UPI001F1FB889|nr:cytochrome c oxidase assembly protein [Methylobacterium sp. C25]MCE4224994.1 cytochrome c oxidase assembly protein [Methylobacterium sp. C25]
MSERRHRPGRLAAGAAGIAVVSGAGLGLRDPLASMASYTAALMVLNQIAPPLLLLALDRPGPRTARFFALAFDPILALTAFCALSVAVSLPGILEPTLANALYAAPLGLLELAAGLLIWAQAIPATRQALANWRAASLLWVASIPMTAVAVVWMLASDVLYTPYLDVICLWNVPPLVDQKWAGFVMFLAGLPMQLAAIWILLGLSDSSDNAA